MLEAWAATPTRAWAGMTRDLSGFERPLTELPGRRWLEVEVHRVDLGTGPTHRDWSDAFVAARLVPMRTGLGDRLPVGAEAPPAGALDERAELAWLYGRLSRPDLPVLGPWS
jgi:maleylpyruvate isomerase